MYSKLIQQECHEMKLRLDLFCGLVLCHAFGKLSQKLNMSLQFL